MISFRIECILDLATTLSQHLYHLLSLIRKHYYVLRAMKCPCGDIFQSTCLLRIAASANWGYCGKPIRKAHCYLPCGKPTHAETCYVDSVYVDVIFFNKII